MSTTEAPALGQAVGTALARMKVVWPAQTWSPELIAEYRRVLSKLDDAATVTETIDRVIDTTPGRFPPPPGAVLGIGEEITRRRIRESIPVRRDDARIDESALRDALAYRSMAQSDAEREYADEQIAAIRQRLREAGVNPLDVESRPGKPRFVEAAEHPFDPPGTKRFVVVQPDGSRVPRGARIKGEHHEEGQWPPSRESGRPFPRGPLNGGAIVSVVALVTAWL